MKRPPLRLPFPVFGVVLADHIKNVNWRARQCPFVCSCPPDVMEEVWLRIEPLFTA